MGHTKDSFLEFSNFKNINRHWNLTLWPMTKWNIANTLEMASHREKWTDIWDSVVIGMGSIWLYMIDYLIDIGTGMGFIWLYSVQGHFGAIGCIQPSFKGVDRDSPNNKH